MYFNIGYEFLGKCIWSDDVILLKFFEEMVRSENILSIVFLDYGGKIMDYVIEIFLGSLEVYSLMFFMIILYKVVECFGKNRMNVFILNQKCFVIFLDLYYIFMFIVVLMDDEYVNGEVSGLF